MKRMLILFLLGFLAAAYCLDSDWGVTPYEWGVVEFNGERIADYCVDDATLNEYSCVDGYAAENKFKCEDYCFDGRCEVAGYVPAPEAGVESDDSDYLAKSLNNPASQAFLGVVAGLLLIGMLSFYAGRRIVN